MADITIAPATVGYGLSASIKSRLIAGETIAPGQVVYRKTSDKKYYLAGNTNIAEATAFGIALSAALVDTPTTILTAGLLTDSSAPFTEGKSYELSSTKGAIAAAGDAGSTDFGTGIGFATSSSELLVAICNSGGQVA